MNFFSSKLAETAINVFTQGEISKFEILFAGIESD